MTSADEMALIRLCLPWYSHDIDRVLDADIHQVCMIAHIELGDKMLCRREHEMEIERQHRIVEGLKQLGLKDEPNG